MQITKREFLRKLRLVGAAGVTGMAHVAVLLLIPLAASAADLEKLAREDYSHAVRPGGVDGREFWNKYSRMFMYPPAFDFSKGGPGTVKYRFTVFDSTGKTHVFDAPTSQSSLSPVWHDVAPGQAWVYVSAVDKDGKVRGIPDWPRDRFSRTFWRSAPFRPGAYPSAPRSYAEAIQKFGDEIFERSATQYFLKTGKPDPNYTHNCYPAKMHSALIQGMLGYAARRPDRAAEALKLARIAADYLISISHSKGAPLEYWPPTYADKREAGAIRYGQNMLIYPSQVGAAYLALYDRVKDSKYLDAARRIGDTYIKLQEKDGTWPLLVRESDGKVLNDNRVQPTGVITFLEKLYRACGDEKYRVCGDKAFAWIEAHPLKDWFWEGQFEDAPLCAKYENPSKHPACELALYLLERFPGDKDRLAIAREILRYAEDQFVCWEKPCAANGHGINTFTAVPSAQENRYNDWFYPCALEQYVYYVPIDASNSKLIRTYLALYRAEKNPLDLAKARALADALVRTQRPSGYIPTEYAKVEKRNDPLQGWLNCSCYTLSVLAELDAVVNGK
jgi:maltose/maltodextrin transport system substrate-binding protein